MQKRPSILYLCFRIGLLHICKAQQIVGAGLIEKARSLISTSVGMSALLPRLLFPQHKNRTPDTDRSQRSTPILLKFYKKYVLPV